MITSRLLSALTLAFLILWPTHTVQAQDYPDTGPQNFQQAKNALTLRDWVDRYNRLDNHLVGFWQLGNPWLGRELGEDLISLQRFSEQAEAALADLDFCLDDQVDWLLMRYHMVNTRDRLFQFQKRQAEVLKILPAGDLRERLPVLTGLIEGIDPEEMIATLRTVRSQIPAPWAAVPKNITLDVARTAGDRARRLDGELTTWLTRVKDRFPKHADVTEQEVKAVQQGLKAFRTWISDEVLPVLENSDQAYGSPVGEARFTARLKNRHLIPESPNELIAFGRDNLARIQARINALSREIDPNVEPSELWQRLKQNHPSREDLPVFVYDEMQRSLQTLLDTGAVTVPESVRENVVELTENRVYETFPFGGYGGWSFRAGKYIGNFLTSPPKAWMSEDEQKARLLGNNVYWARVVAVHEIFPGHHLASAIAYEHTRTMRRISGTDTYSEGWGLYSEMMMFRLGFFPDKETELAMLKMQAWRASRVIIDVSLHLGRMPVEEAVTFLMENVDMTRDNALAEVRRYLGNPTRPLSYIYGFRKIEALRAAVMAKQGDQFDQRAFHDRFLRIGSIPLPLVESLMLGTPLPQGPPPLFPDSP